MTGAEAIVKTLEALGVERVFGIPGAQNMELFDAFTSSKKLTSTLVTHELCASFMADAMARATGRPGVCALVPGPGITNAFTGIGEALLDSSPVVVLVPAVRDNIKEKFQLHEIDQLSAVRPLVKGVFRTGTIEEIPRKIREAFSLAQRGEPGPVVVETPMNPLMESGQCSDPGPVEEAAAAVDEDEVDRAADMLRKAGRPGIYAGLGAMDASAEVKKLADILQAPVCTTISGRGVIPEDQALAAGFGFVKVGTAAAVKAFEKCDALLAIGCKFGEVATGSYGLKPPDNLIHMDINPETIGANHAAAVRLCGDARKILPMLLNRLEGHEAKRRLELIEQINALKEEDLERVKNEKMSSDYVNPAKFLLALRNLAPRETIVTTDSGNHTFWVIPYFPIYRPRTFLCPTDYQAMGFSVPAAVGAKLAFPDRKVISFVGDGGFLMTGMEILTAIREDLDIMVVLFNDGALGLIKEGQKELYRRATNTDLQSPDFEKLAASLGMGYVPVRSDNDIHGAVADAASKRGCVLVDVRVRYFKHTRYFKGVALSNFRRMAPGVKLRMGARAVKRMIFSD